MQIIPNFIEDRQIQEEIKNTLTGERSIPYYYNSYTVNENDKSDFHFVHFLYENNTHPECSPMFDKILSPLIESNNLKLDSVLLRYDLYEVVKYSKLKSLENLFSLPIHFR